RTCQTTEWLPVGPDLGARPTKRARRSARGVTPCRAPAPSVTLPRAHHVRATFACPRPAFPGSGTADLARRLSSSRELGGAHRSSCSSSGRQFALLRFSSSSSCPRIRSRRVVTDVISLHEVQV